MSQPLITIVEKEGKQVLEVSVPRTEVTEYTKEQIERERDLQLSVIAQAQTRLAEWDALLTHFSKKE